MILTSRMNHLTAIVLRREMENITGVLLQQGVMDFIKSSEIPALNDIRLHDVKINESSARIKEGRLRIEKILESANSAPLMNALDSPETGKKDSLDKIEKMLEAVSGEEQVFRDKQKELQIEINRLDDMKRQVDMFGDESSLLARAEKGSSDFSFLFMQTGNFRTELKKELEEALASFPTVLLDTAVNGGKTHAIVMGMKKDQSELEKRLISQGWQKGPLPTEAFADSKGNNRASADCSKKIIILKVKQKELKEKSFKYITDRKEWLQNTWSDLRIRELNLKIQSFFRTSESCILFNGWVPEEHKEALNRNIRKAAGAECILEWHNAGWITEETEGRLKVPVEMNNPEALKPFEMLVRNFGTPEYGTIDPTPLVALTYLCMFALMFGDAGHGAVLLATGWILHIRNKKRGNKPNYLFTLIAYCGAASVLSGFLFGSYFGYSLLPPLWFNYHAVIAGHDSGHPGIQSIFDILLITIWFGIAVLGSGIVLNMINCIRKKDWVTLVFSKSGIIGVWMYSAGIYTAFHFAGSGYKTLPSGPILIAGLGIPALLLLLKEPLQNKKNGSHHAIGPSMIMNIIMEWLVELLEIFSGYLANTLSFMRVAGLGIAHVSLMIAFFEMSDMAPLAARPFILLLGNALVIALEGLSAGIQSLRLNYYEFFSKYFDGSGKAYNPLSMSSRLSGGKSDT